MTDRPNHVAVARRALVATILSVTLAAAFAVPADARGGHGRGGFGHGGFGGGMHGAHFEGGGRRGNDPYIKAASDEADRLLTTKLKSICRGC